MLRLRLLALLAFLATSWLTATASFAGDDSRQARPASGSGDTLRVVPDRAATINHIQLDLKVDLEQRKVDSKADVAFHTLRPTDTIALDAVGFKISKVSLGEGSQAAPAKYEHDGKKLTVHLGDRWLAGRPGRVHVEYVVDKPRNGLHFFAPTPTNPDIPLEVWSQGETTFNRYWVPCLDDPDVKQTTRLVVTVKKGQVAVSNGRLVSTTENSDGTVTFDWNQDIPHPSYLITLAVSDFEVVQEDWDGTPVIYYMPKGYAKDAKATYGRTPEMLAYYSKRFGIRYPWAKYAQVTAYQFGGAMENTSATTMTDSVLRDARMLLDSSGDDIIAHELTHQWWGDMVTCRDWSHLWLNEGFATYGEALWQEHVAGKDGYDYTMYQKGPAAVLGGRTRPTMDRRYTSPDAMFDGRSYPKGGWILHMLRRKLGDETFFRGLKEYGTQYKFQNAETMEFRRVLERVSGRSLERFFYDWLERSGSPALTVKVDYLPGAKAATITVKQTQTAEAYSIPIKVALYCAGSNEPVVVEEEMTGKELTLKPTLTGALERIDFDPDQAVLADVRETQPAELWNAQLGAPSVALRMRAIRHFAEAGAAAEHRELLAKAFAAEKFFAAKMALANLLGSAGEHIGRDALIQGLTNKDARIRRSCVLNLSKFKKDDAAISVVRGILTKGDASYGVENAAMEIYAGMGRDDAIELIKPYLDKPSFQHTTQIAALNALTATQNPAAFEALATWAGPGHPRTTRLAARRGLVSLVDKKKLSDEQLDRLVSTYIETLEKEPTDRSSVLHLLPNLGKHAGVAIPVVEKLSAQEGYWQTTAKDVAKRLHDLTKAGEKKD